MRERCADCSGHCAIGLGGGDRAVDVGRDQLRATWPPEPGTQISLFVAPAQLQHAVVRRLGWPLIGLLAGAGTGEWLSDFNGGAMPVLSAMVGMLAAGALAFIRPTGAAGEVRAVAWREDHAPGTSNDQFARERNPEAPV